MDERMRERRTHLLSMPASASARRAAHGAAQAHAPREGAFGNGAPMMLLIGMKISFTKKPIKPMIAKPIEVACAIFENSVTARREQHACLTGC